ncbi:hypothetical protein BDN70DRAFT_837955 [Pholiota conissans]|uniref:RRM domain-containing protein n=1 Tax=Pholiota conissans TaxID=109636 RepID=A0A9P5YXM3_9AGAR|nr:hypothetical protein BDN70DRAFT_837955 [Pholiota conissans]
MSKAASLAADSLRDATHIVLRGLPKAATSRDIQRAVMQADVKGVSEVSIYYRHFRPTGKAVLTMSLPDFTRNAVHRLQNTRILGVRPEAEPILSPEKMLRKSEKGKPFEATGDGPSAGVIPGKTVSLSGLPGRTGIDSIYKLVTGFKLESRKNQPSVQVCLIPEKKFSLFSRFCVHLESEGEAQRLVRALHMTHYKDLEGAPLIKAEIIY